MPQVFLEWGSASIGSKSCGITYACGKLPRIIRLPESAGGGLHLSPPASSAKDRAELQGVVTSDLLFVLLSSKAFFVSSSIPSSISCSVSMQ